LGIYPYSSPYVCPLPFPPSFVSFDAYYIIHGGNGTDGAMHAYNFGTTLISLKEGVEEML